MNRVIKSVREHLNVLILNHHVTQSLKFNDFVMLSSGGLANMETSWLGVINLIRVLYYVGHMVPGEPLMQIDQVKFDLGLLCGVHCLGKW